MRAHLTMLATLLGATVAEIAQAQWQLDGMRVSTFESGQFEPASCTDGAGGTIIAWVDDRSPGNFDLYIQRLDASGNRLWTSDGLPLCTVATNQTFVRLAPDGVGGALAVWTDRRLHHPGAGLALFAQRVNAAGAPQWTAGGVVVDANSYNTSPPAIVSDGTGGAIFAWQDGILQNGTDDIYVQRISAVGAVLWGAGGVALTTAAGMQRDPVITDDGSGGAIVAWVSGAVPAGNIFVRRVNSAGAPQWTANGVALCTAAGDQGLADIVSDGAGGAIVTWADFRGDGDIYARRVSSTGVAQWAANGVAVCAVGGQQSEPSALALPAGGAIIAWSDSRASSPGVYAQRIDGTGAGQWSIDGNKAVSVGSQQLEPSIVPDGAGGAVIAWLDLRLGSQDVFSQRLDASGARQWASGGVPVTIASSHQHHLGVVPDGAGSAIVVWHDDGTLRVKAQKATPDLAQPPVSGKYVAIPAVPANALVTDVDLRPQFAGAFSSRAFLPVSGNLHVVNTLTDTVEAVIPLSSASVAGIDFTDLPGTTWGVMVTLGSTTFYEDITAPSPAPTSIFPHTDAPLLDCDPLFIDAGSFFYCVVSYVGSIRVFRIANPGGAVTSHYTVARSSVGLDAVDTQTDGTNLYVPNSTTLDFVTLATGAVYSSVTLPFPAKREVDLVWLPSLSRGYWPLDGAILRVHATGFIESTTPIAGTSVEGVDMAVALIGPTWLGAFPTTGFVHLMDLNAGTLIGSCPTPGAVVRNFDPLITEGNLTGPADGLVYWSVIGTTYAIDPSSPGAPQVVLDTPGGLVDGCDLTASNDKSRAVLPHPGLTHVLDLATASVLGTVETPGDLVMDVDPIFPPPHALAGIGSKVVQPYPGGMLVVKGFTGASDQCVVTTSTTLYVLDLTTVSINQSFALAGLVEGVDPVITQGQPPTFDYDPWTARDVDQDFLCHDAQRVIYYSRPVLDPGVYTIWHEENRLPYTRSGGIPGSTHMDPFTRVRATILADRQTIAFNDLSGAPITTMVTTSPIVGGFIANRDLAYCSVLLQDGKQIPIEMLPLSLTGTPQPLGPIQHPAGVHWPMVGDLRSGLDLGLTSSSEGLTLTDPRTGTLLQTFALPAPAIFAPVVDYKNQVASVLLRDSQRAILDLKPLDWGLPATLTVVPFANTPYRYPVSNTVYEPNLKIAMNLSFDVETQSYGFWVTDELDGGHRYLYTFGFPPVPMVHSDPKSGIAKVLTFSGFEYIFDLSPLGAGGGVVVTDVGPIFPWRFAYGFSFYDRFQISVTSPTSFVVTDTYAGTIASTLTTSHPILGPPVMDPQNRCARIRLASGYSLFVDFFELAKGNPTYYRYDQDAAALADEPLFDPHGGMDLTLDVNQNLVLRRSRSGQVIGSLVLPAQPVRPLRMDPHNRVVEAILPGGQMYHLDLSDVDGSGPATLSLQPVDLGGIPLAASDLTPPPAANTPGLQLSPIGVDGIVRIDAPAGTVEPHAYVTIGNRSRRSLEPVDVMANASGGFVAYALADSADTVCVLIADAAGNHGPDACLQVNSSKATTDASKPRLKTGLLAPSPNPSHGDVQISFALAQAGRITIDVLDVAGRRVRRVLNGQLEAGQHAILWDGRNDRAQRVSAGFYFVRYTAEGRNFVKRVVRIASP